MTGARPLTHGACPPWPSMAPPRLHSGREYQLSMMTALLVGLVVGFVLAIPPGPIAMACIHQALAGQVREGVALVLGASASGHPGVLVADFTGPDCGKLPCPVMIIPGSLSDERLEQLS